MTIKNSDYMKAMAKEPSITLIIEREHIENGLVSYERVPLMVDDESYRYRTIMGEHTLTLQFKLPGYKNIPIGTYCNFQGLIYTLESPENIVKNGKRNFEYRLILQSQQYKLQKYIIRNRMAGDKRLTFSYTALPEDFLNLIVENMNDRDPNRGWTVGDNPVKSSERTVSFSHNTCMEALQMIAEAFETEWEVTNRTINLKKIEHNAVFPLSLSYGRGKGLLPGLSQGEYTEAKPVGRLFVQGGERNIDASKYRKNESTGQAVSHTLLMSANRKIKFDGISFDDEKWFDLDAPEVREYITDADGFSVCRADKVNIKDLIEGSFDCAEIYPMREGEVTGAEIIKGKHFFTDNDVNIPDYTKYLIDGETKTVIFQTGMLSGREFEFEYKHPGQFEIIPQTIDGIEMPGDVYVPKSTNKYAVFNVMMPDTYIADAELRMLKEAVKHLYENEQPRVTISATLDGVWARGNWARVGSRLVLGGTIFFSDEQFMPEGGRIRITGIKDYVNNPFKPELELSNYIKKGSWIRKAKLNFRGAKTIGDIKNRNVMQLTKRRLDNVLEKMNEISVSMLDHSENINTLTAHSMVAIIGNESSHFEYSCSSSGFVFNPENENRMFVPGGTITHKTLNRTHKGFEGMEIIYLKWSMNSDNSFILDDPKERYYLYAKVPHHMPGSIQPIAYFGQFLLTKNAIKMDDVPDYYHLLVGILNSEINGNRDFTPLFDEEK